MLDCLKVNFCFSTAGDTMEQEYVGLLGGFLMIHRLQNGIHGGFLFLIQFQRFGGDDVFVGIGIALDDLTADQCHARTFEFLDGGLGGLSHFQEFLKWQFLPFPEHRIQFFLTFCEL